MRWGCRILMSGGLKFGQVISLLRSVLRNGGLFGKLSILSMNILLTRVRSRGLFIGRSRVGSLMCRGRSH